MAEQTVKKIDLDVQIRAASFAPASIDEAGRTVELVWTTGASVRRMGWDGERFDEVLEVSAGAIRLDRLNAGAPLLLDHQQNTASQVGIVERAWIADGKGHALVRFSKRADVDGVWGDVRDGILKNVSVGYRINRILIEERDGDVPIYRVVDWEPLEISLVSVPADAGASVRSSEGGVKAPCEVVRASVSYNDAETAETADAGAPAEENITPAEEKRNMSDIKTEDGRAEVKPATATEIRSLVSKVGLGADVALDLIERGVSSDEARAAVLDAVAAKAEATKTSSVRSEHNDKTLDNPAAKRQALEDALAARVLGKAPEGAAREFGQVGIVGLARELTGQTRAQASDVVERAMQTTADFPLILGNVANKALIETYKLVVPTYTKFAMRRDVNDFKPHSFLSLGEFAGLTEKTESGDYDTSSIGEKGETIQAKELGRIYHLSRRAMINDDLGAFGDIARRAVTSARLSENTAVYGALAANPVLSEDGATVFHASHGNLVASGTGEAPSIQAVATARAAMMKQTSIDGFALNIVAKYLVVGPDNELAARRIVAATTPASADQVNPWSGTLEVIVDANLGLEWYLVAEPMLAPTVVYGYVQGVGPTFKTETKFESQSVKFLMINDFATGLIDYRGIFKNAGQ